MASIDISSFDLVVGVAVLRQITMMNVGMK